MECYVDDYMMRNGAKIILDIMHEKEAHQKLIELHNENTGLKQFALQLVEKLKFLELVLVSMVNPFLANIPILYPLKTSESLWFCGFFKGYKMGTLARNGLSWIVYSLA